MIFEECPITKAVNDYWNEKILDAFPILLNATDAKFLSLKEYIVERPQKFFNKKAFNDYYTYLIAFKNTNTEPFINLYRTSEHDLNIAIKSLNDTNNISIHDIFIPENNVEVIRLVENHIHFNYLKLTEAVYHKFIRFIAYNNRLFRKKPVDGLDIYNCVEEVRSTELSYLTTNYHNTIRNGIAHGGITYKESDTIYRGKTGDTFEIRTKNIIRIFDDLLDICNGFLLALKVFLILNKEFLQENNLNIPKQVLIQELKSQSNAPKWKVIDCLENVILDGRKQLNIFTENKLLAFQEVNYYAFRTAVLTEFFAPGYDRYFIYLKSKYSLPGWAAYNGKILERERKNNDNDLDGYRSALEENLLFFVPKYRIPNFIKKVLSIISIARNNFHVHFHSSTSNIFNRKYEIRVTKPFRRGLAVFINDPCIYIYPEYKNEAVEIIRNDYKKIVRYTNRKSKKEMKSFISRFLPSK